MTKARLVKVSVLNVIVALVLVGNRYPFVAGDTRLHRRDEVTGHIPSTHDEIVARREEHHDTFSSRLADVNMKLGSHSSGERLLTEAEFNRLNRKKKAYENKLEELGREFDERHSSRIIGREEMLNEMTKARIGRSREEL
jgi:hypothetical protein